MNPVFLDTVGLLGLWNRNDQWHVEAKRVFAELTAGGTQVMTTDFVLLEAVAVKFSAVRQ